MKKILIFAVTVLTIGLTSCHKDRVKIDDQPAENVQAVDSVAAAAPAPVVEEPDPIKDAFELAYSKNSPRYVHKLKQVKQIFKKDYAGFICTDIWDDPELMSECIRLGKSTDGRVYLLSEAWDLYCLDLYYDTQERQLYVHSWYPDYGSEDEHDIVKKYRVGGGKIPEDIKYYMKSKSNFNMK